LLVSTRGWQVNPGEADEALRDEVYQAAYSMGILTRAQRNDNAAVTRAELTKLLLDGAGYSEVAALKDIFKCNFSDQAAIPAEYYGYAALAQGLGLVSGDGAGRFAPGRAAIRAEAAVMLYNLMDR
ncbi:MAG: S-layer homology domain-containing protein, partial [Clostridiales bacterium]|nr:S-layer homology domain-containing protein [Clostridiales bacterium]